MPLSRVRRALLLTTALLLAPFPSAVAFEALVRLPDGLPAADAQVLLLGHSGAARTGPDGRFRWVPEPRPPFEVLVVLPGDVYTVPMLVEALPTGGNPLVLTVQLAARETVMVDSGATPHTEAPPGNAASLVVREDIEQRRPENLTDAIAQVPGAGRVGEGVAAVPSLRGLAGGRTLILIDGARVTSERRAGPSATFLDPASLEAVEVARGPGAVAWGSDSFGGVIHARTRKAPLGGGWGGALEASAGGGAPRRTILGQLTRGLKDGGVLLEARYRDFDDYESPEGTVPGSGFRDGGVRGQLHHEAGPGRLRVGWQGDFGRDLGKPSAEWDTDRTVYPEERSLRMTVGYDGDAVGDLQRWWLDGFLGSSRLITLRTSGMASAEERRQADISSRDWGLRASGAGAVGGVALRGGTDLYGRFGLDALETVTPAGGEPDAVVAIEDASSSDLGAWITTEGRVLAPLLLSAGLRYDRVASGNTGGHFGDRRTGANALSGTVSLVGGPVAGLTVAGQVSRGFRAPTLSQLYYRGVTGRGFVTGNPDLQPERSLQYDVAVRRPGRVRLSLYLYRYEIRDLIERYRDGDDFFFRNRGQALLRGAELEAQAELGGGFSAELGLTAAEGHAVDDGAPLSDVPAEGLTLTLNRRLGHRGQLWARFLARARRGDPGPVERVVPSYAVLDLGGAWRFGEGVEARVLAGNLLDETYLGSPDELTVPAPGRHLVVTLSARF